MPLTEKVTFKNPLEACSKVQVPKIIRWQFKIEPKQVLRVGIREAMTDWEYFYARIGKDGRIYIPKTAKFTLFGKNQNLAGYLLEISLEPA